MDIQIVQTDYTPDSKGIVTVHWTASKTDGEYTASTYGAESFQPDPESSNFKPFEELTESDIIGWLLSKELTEPNTESDENENITRTWEDHVEERLDAELDRLKNPPMLHGLPWNSQ
jgi:hypothetical protein